MKISICSLPQGTHRTRQFLCHLPTEVVIPYAGNGYTGPYVWMNHMQPIDMQHIPLATAYFYRCSDTLENIDRKFKYYIEIHQNYGDDGHVEWQFTGTLLGTDKLPETFKEYKDMVNKA